MVNKHDIKKDFKKKLLDSEVKITESILCWRYKKEKKPLPDKEVLQQQSRIISEQANKIVTGRLKNIWNQIKYECGKIRNKGDN